MKAKPKKRQSKKRQSKSPPPAPAATPDLMDEKRAAKHIAMSVAYLRAGRCSGVTGGTTPHPPYLKLGRAIRYQRTDLDTWLAARRVTPTPRPAAPDSNAPAAG